MKFSSAGFGALVLWYLLISLPLGFDGVELRYVTQSLSLAERASFFVDPYYPFAGDIAKVGDHYIPAVAPGLSLLGAPFAGLGRQLYTVLPESLRKALSERLRAHSTYLAARASMAPEAEVAKLWFVLLFMRLFFAVPIACLLAWLFHRLIASWKGVEEKTPILLALFAASLYSYLARVTPYGMSSCLLLALALLWSKGLWQKKAVWVGFFAALLACIEYPFATVSLLIALYFMRSLPLILRFALGAAVPTLFFAAYHTYYFGAPWILPHKFLIGYAHHKEGLFGVSWPGFSAFWRVLFSLEDGFFLYNPLLLLAVFYALYGLSKQREAFGLFCQLPWLVLAVLEAGFYQLGGSAGPFWGQRHLVSTLAVSSAALAPWLRQLAQWPLQLFLFLCVVMQSLAAWAPYEKLHTGDRPPIVNLGSYIASGQISFPALEQLQSFFPTPWLIGAGSLLTFVFACALGFFSIPKKT